MNSRPRQRRARQGGGASAAVLSAALQQHLVSSSMPSRSRRSRREATKLARAVGAIEGERPGLGEGEWAEAERQSVERGDCNGPCAICHEPFSLREQSILSCSHTFHTACVRSFERFAGGARRCPMCRATDYERRATSIGADACRARAAAVVQRAWRGHAARRAFARVLACAEGLDPAGPLMRRRRLGRVQQASARYMAEAEAREGELDRFLADLDRSVERSRRAVADASRLMEGLPDGFWNEVRARLEARGRLDDCPVCMEAARPGERPCSLLSCSHVYHTACVESFERFAARRAADDTAAEASQAGAPCPLCRQEYQRCAWEDVFTEERPFVPAAVEGKKKLPPPPPPPQQQQPCARKLSKARGGRVPSYARPRARRAAAAAASDR